MFVDFYDSMRATLGSGWAYLLAFGFLIVWGIIAKLSNRDR